MSRIETLAEQTEFLLEKQKEVLAFFKSEFELLYEMLGTEQEKAEAVKAGAELASFQNVRSMLEVHEQQSIKDLEEDVAFLKEQFSAIKQVKEIPDEHQQDELIDMMLEKGQELAETNRFKADIEGEAEQAKSGFHSMIDDIKIVLCEDGIKELEMILEAHAASQDEKEEVEDDECCGSEISDCSCCTGCVGKNIFEGFEVEIEDDETKKKTK